MDAIPVSVRFLEPEPHTDDTNVEVTYADGTKACAWWGREVGGILAWRAEHGDEAALPYVAPAPTFPPLSPRQLRLMMLQIGLTDADVEAQIAAIPDPTERAAASIEWQWATRYDRTHPLVATLATALEFTDAELNSLWSYAADL